MNTRSHIHTSNIDSAVFVPFFVFFFFLIFFHFALDRVLKNRPQSIVYVIALNA